MATKGKKKGKKGKKKKIEKVDPDALTEVDKTFYELIVTDLNRKLARLRSLTAELEEKNTGLQEQLDKLDEDRSDIIAFLKKTLQERSDEIAELQERLRALHEARSDEKEEYETRIQDLQNEYKQMHEQLTSEIKLLDGKLNSLEEFRVQRDELMRKFEIQEEAMEAQEKRHKMELYDIERKFIIGKDKLKKDMEARLLQLSTEYQDATELRVAATTHRVIRENIAINNELDDMLQSQRRLYEENTSMKQRDMTLRQRAELYETERNKALTKVKVQLKIIDKLTKEHQTMTAKLHEYHKLEEDMHVTRADLINQKDIVSGLNFKIKILEQNLHATRCNENSMKTELEVIRKENMRLADIIHQAVFSIKEALRVKSKSASTCDVSLDIFRRENLLNHLYALLTESEAVKCRKWSLESVQSMDATYQRGDLGFVPKDEPLRASVRTFRTIEVQMGPSFEDFVTAKPDCKSQISLLREASYGRSARLSEVMSKSGLELEHSDQPDEISDVFFADMASADEEMYGEDEEERTEGFVTPTDSKFSTPRVSDTGSDKEQEKKSDSIALKVDQEADPLLDDLRKSTVTFSEKVLVQEHVESEATTEVDGRTTETETTADEDEGDDLNT